MNQFAPGFFWSPTAIPTLPPAGDETQEIRAVLLFDIQFPELDASFPPGWFTQYQVMAVGAPGAYLDGRASVNLGLWLTLQPADEDRIIARFRIGTGSETHFVDYITLPDDLEPGSYRLIFPAQRQFSRLSPGACGRNRTHHHH